VDGWNASGFHAKCDGAGPTVVVGTTRGGGAFAAYNPLGWYSVEDYRAASDAVIIAWPSSDGIEAFEAPNEALGKGVACRNVSDPAIYDFAAQGPCFGSDALQIPLGVAPKHGSSYAGSGMGSLDLGAENAAGSRIAKSRLGSNFAADAGAELKSVFTKSEGTQATLMSLRAYASPALMRRDDDGALYVS
jgi:hypothetical protein